MRIKELAERAGARLRVVKLDVDEHPVTASRYRVLGLPTLLLLVDGTPVLELRGARSKTALDRELDRKLDRMSPDATA